jgi:signal transduction histidine kinase
MYPAKINLLKTIIWLLFISITQQVICSTASITENDSLNRKLRSMPDSSKISFLLKLSREHGNNDLPQSLEFARQALNYAEAIKDTGLIGVSNLKIAEVYLLKGAYDKSLGFLLEALKQFEKTGSMKEIAYCSEVLGKVHFAIQDHYQAVEFYKKALAINKKLNLLPAVVDNYTDLGSAFVEMDSIDKGLSYYLVSLMILDSLGLDEEKSDLLIQIGNGYFKLNKFKESLINYYMAMELAEKNKDLYRLAQVKSRIGVAYFRQNNIPAALKYSRECLKLTNVLKTFRIAGESYKNLAEIYASQNNFNKAYEYYVQYKNVSDSLLNEEKSLQISKLQAKYDLQQIEKENELLKQQNTLKSNTIQRMIVAAAIIAALLFFSILQVVMLIRLNRRLRDLNRKLAEQGKELEELNDQKDKFFSFVAHNLNNPFNAIMGFSDLMVKKSDSKEYDKLDRYAKHIQSLSVHVHKILENLLEWSRLQRRSFEYRPEKIEINSLILDVIEMNNKEAARKDIELSYDLAENLSANADRFMVTIILQNLMSNALNFTPSSGKIHVSVILSGPQVKISISDTGIGIAHEDLPKLFRIDIQPAKIGTAESKGAGLGLVICKEMVQRCGGDIIIDSQLSKGTTVTFTLPLSNGNSTLSENESVPQNDFSLEMKNDLEIMGKLPEAFVETCKSSLLLKYNEVRSILSLENLIRFARDVEDTGSKYNVQAFVHYGNHLSTLAKTHQIDKILGILPEFKKMLDIFST